MNFRIFLNCDNAAFDDYGHDEIARILTDLAGKIAGAEELPEYLTLMDRNGNSVGRATFSEE
jgi:hypothetical protein